MLRGLELLHLAGLKMVPDEPMRQDALSDSSSTVWTSESESHIVIPTRTEEEPVVCTPGAHGLWMLQILVS